MWLELDTVEDFIYFVGKFRPDQCYEGNCTKVNDCVMECKEKHVSVYYILLFI